MSEAGLYFRRVHVISDDWEAQRFILMHDVLPARAIEFVSCKFAGLKVEPLRYCTVEYAGEGGRPHKVSDVYVFSCPPNTDRYDIATDLVNAIHEVSSKYEDCTFLYIYLELPGYAFEDREPVEESVEEGEDI